MKLIKLIKITTVYNEVFIRTELKRNNNGVFTSKGFVPFEDILFIDILGNLVVDKYKDSDKE